MSNINISEEPKVSTSTIERVTEAPVKSTMPAATPVVAVKRRTIDAVLIGAGVVATLVFAVAGGLLTWGSNFSDDYVGKELASQNISFPDAAALTEEGRADLLEFAGQKVDTGDEAEGYASFINGHLNGIADGATYSELGTPQNAAKADVKAAVEANKPQAEIDALQAKVTAITAQRTSLFTGETLRGLLLSAYAWSTVGMIAGIAAIGAFIAAAITAVLVVLGFFHHHKAVKAS
jgi:hypothetical protein